MGYSILELVLRRLREGNFAAGAAFPGQTFPKIQGPAAAVHIAQVDRANLTVTVEVSILCPAAMGGTACEVEALRATEILRWAGAVCVQNGCSYDGTAQVYVVNILATFTGVTEAEECTIWQGFYVYIDEQLQRFAVGFSEEDQTGVRAEYAMGESTPGGYSRGKRSYGIAVEEVIPVGSPEETAETGEFTLKLTTQQKTVCYTGCRWTEVNREYTKQGLRRVRKGLARERQET